jgi:hypothetical protein
MKCKRHSNNDLIENINPGIEHEIAVAFHLMGEQQKKQEDFYSNVVIEHPRSTRIKGSIENLITHSEEVDWPDIFLELKSEESYYVSLAYTQEDSVGPADVIICCCDEIQFGVSVKFRNRNNWNPSALNFINENDKEELIQLYKQKYLSEHLSHMKERYGKCEYIDSSNNYTNWYRKRSKITDLYIDIIRDRVIKRWNEKNEKEKEKILKAAYHDNSTIDYFDLILQENKPPLISSPQPIPTNISDIQIEKHKTSAVCFYLNGKLTDNLQVKANNGFIERHGNRNSFYVNDIKWGHGDFFGSWDWTFR